MKQCNKCGGEFPLEMMKFERKRGGIYYHPLCKSCCNARWRKKYAENCRPDRKRPVAHALDPLGALLRGIRVVMPGQLVPRP